MSSIVVGKQDVVFIGVNTFCGTSDPQKVNVLAAILPTATLREPLPISHTYHWPYSYQF